MATNDHLVLIVGKSSVGKSASLMGLENQERIAYLNCEAGKKLPFRSKMKEVIVTDPMQVSSTIAALQGNQDYDTCIIDSLTFMMDMYESQHVLGSANTMAGWSNYAQFFKNIMQTQIAASDKAFIFTAHTSDIMSGEGLDMVKETCVKVKGSLMNQGVEAYFSTVIACKKMSLKALEPYQNDMLTITPEEEALGFKYVYQTKLTKDTVNERIRSPLGMFSTAESFTDNNAQLILNRLKEYYN